MITCPICLKQYKKIDIQHLRKHNLSLEEYRNQYGEDAPYGYSEELLDLKSGENHHYFGKKRSEIECENISKGTRLMWRTHEATLRQKEHAREMAYKNGIHVNLGRKHDPRSEEHSHNLSIALKEFYSGNPRSEEHRKAIANSKLGIPLSREHRKAISIGLQQRLTDLGFKSDLSKLPEYTKQVRIESEKTYLEYKHLINPDDYKRGIKDYHLDHLIPIVHCFLIGIDVDVAGGLGNLQMMWWMNNLQKGTYLDIIEEDFWSGVFD